MKSAFFVCALLLLSQQSGAWYRDQAQKAIELCQKAQRREAFEILDAMKQEAQKQDNQELVFFVQWKRGYCEYILGDLTEAQKTLKAALDKAPKGLRFLNLIHRDLGEAYLASGQAAQAETHLRIVLDSAAGKGPIENPLRLDEAERIRIGLCHVRSQAVLGKFEAAKKELDLIAEQIAKAGDKSEPRVAWASRHAQCQMLLSGFDRRNHNMVRALQRLEASRESLQGFTSPDALQLQFSCSLDLARCYWLLARFAEAERHIDFAGKIVLFIPTERNLADLKNARAGLAIEKTSFAIEKDAAVNGILPELDRAEQALKEALQHYAKADRGQDIFTANTNFQLAQVHDLRGRTLAFRGAAPKAVPEYEEGKRRCDRAFELFTTLLPANNDLVLEVRQKRAWLLYRLGDLANARKEAEEALEVFAKEHGKDDLDCGRFHHLLVEVESRAGNQDKAAAHGDAHRRLVAKELVTFLAGLTAPEQVQFFRKWDDPGLHASLRLGIQHAGLTEQSAEWLLNGKAKVAEVLANVHQRARGREDYRVFQHAIQRQAYLLYGQAEPDPKIVERELLWEESKKRDLSAAWPVRDSQRWFTLNEVRQRLGDKEVYVGIFCLRPQENAPRAYYAWVVTKQGPVNVATLGDAAEIEKLVHDLLDHQERFPTIRLQGERKAENDLREKCLKPLSRFVLDPILKLAGGKERWIISPDGPLWNVPWAALVLPKSEKYAIEEMSFRYVISGRELVEQAADKVALGPPVILGDPDLDRAPPGMVGKLRSIEDPLYSMPLNASERECQLIAAGIKETLKIDPQLVVGLMTKDALLGLPRPPRMAYLSTHGFSPLPSKTPVDDPLLSCAIAFAGWNFLPTFKQSKEPSLPGMMTGAEVLAIDLKGTELVVLASCRSGTGVLQYGQSPADLRHAFHLAGAQAVVSSLWGVNDKSTMDLMVPFMDKLCRQDGARKADALRDSQLQLLGALRQHRNHAHPFYWAAFTVSGS